MFKSHAIWHCRLRFPRVRGGPADGHLVYYLSISSFELIYVCKINLGLPKSRSAVGGPIAYGYKAVYPCAGFDTDRNTSRVMRAYFASQGYA